MRLLNTRTGRFRWVDGPAEVKYAVLSHVWSRGEEQSYQDLLRIQCNADGQDSSNEGSILLAASPKIRNACAHALADGIEYIWMDLCCIDKTSSAEVSDAVLSMYAWYTHAAVCYAYLDDVEADEDPRLPSAKFRWSRWHTRGWTLPEVIAPKAVTFLSADWRALGTKHELAEVLEAVTGVDKGVLTHDVPLDSISVARRMSWAAKRLTTRQEDEAYALLGLFGIHIPIMYGEGAHAFLRLQEEILRTTMDQSLFVWGAGMSDCALDAELYDETRHTLLASSPAAFARSAGVQVIRCAALVGPEQRTALGGELPAYEFTPYGIRTWFPMLSVGPKVCLALLPCLDEDGGRLALVLKKTEDAATVHTVGIAGWEGVRARYRASLRTLPWNTDPAQAGNPSITASEETFTRVVKLNRPWPKTIPSSKLYIAHRPLNSLSVRPPAAHPGISAHPRIREPHDDLILVDRMDSSLRGVLWVCLADALDAVVSLLSLGFIIAVALFLGGLFVLLMMWMVGRHPLLVLL
ncbi:HET-domain-containing protein [Lentinus tigrinus ALCF2SS1-7]|uniref:HET-domain-containing protein n=1 Tax=Lentinus tigrinus ALCF2SS1-6 TaxID=1328759 RepID=A0A5C2RX34_9APHY|nr:HET-domain-containing protein [Lentinus tigrinus ALCF2SS1-6]RPD70666.1 HET-domain-containing protein [Lentinus tigrinus ALCF2SS1-7]